MSDTVLIVEDDMRIAHWVKRYFEQAGYSPEVAHDGESGLAVKTRDGVWRAVPCVRNAYVVNIGDLLAAWTNHRWRSSLHRVVFPEDPGVSRLTSPLFFNPSIDAVIACVPTCVGPDGECLDPVAAGEWIAAKIAATTRETV